MVKLESIVKEALKKLIIPISAILMSASAFGQNVVSGNVKSVPSMNPSKAKVQFVDKTTGTKYTALSDSVTGNFSMKLPNGNYVQFVEAPNNFQYKDENVNINGNTNQNVSLIENLAISSSYYDNVLQEIKELTLTRDIDGRSVKGRMPTNVRIYPRNYNPADTYLCPI